MVGHLNFRTVRLRNNQNKMPKKGGDIGAVAVVKTVRQLSCGSQDAEPPESIVISRKGISHRETCCKKFRCQFDEYDSQGVGCVR